MTNKFDDALSDWNNMVNGGMSETTFLNKHEQLLCEALELASALQPKPMKDINRRLTPVGSNWDVTDRVLFRIFSKKAASKSMM